MDAKQAILAGALLNAELMEQRDDARAQAGQLVEEVDRLNERLKAFETVGESAKRAD